jgi:hypothetical protein
MQTDELHVALSRVVHDLWRAKLSEEGWKLGSFDPVRKHHDALVPYDRLSRGDRLAISLHIQAEEFEAKLASGFSYPRGPNRPLLVEEVRVGLPVAFCPDGRPVATKELTPDLRGEVVSWEREPDGELGLVTVKWGNGNVEQCDPWNGDLARIDELR